MRHNGHRSLRSVVRLRDCRTVSYSAPCIFGHLIGESASGAPCPHLHRRPDRRHSERRRRLQGHPLCRPTRRRLAMACPQAPTAVVHATRRRRLRPSCPQRSPPEHVLPSSRGATTSEDCLTLNVWTPTQRPQQAMPVMVWIHGGGNNSGTSAQTYYDGPPSRATGPAHRQPPPTTARKSRSYLPPGLTTD